VPGDHPTLAVSRFEGRTLPALLARTAARLPGKVFLHHLDPAAPAAPPRLLTFEAFRRQVARATSFLRSAGTGPGDRVLLLAENSPAWQAFALAAQHLRAEPAALFASLAPEAAQETARRVRPRVAVVSSGEQWEKLAPTAAELAAAGLRAVVSGTALDPGALPGGLRAATVAETTGEGAPTLTPAELDALAGAVGEEDPFLLLFTSGTSGRPKGVRLPQRAIVHAIDGGGPATAATEADLGLHFLPFAHVAGHDQFALALAQGHGLVMFSRREDLERGLALSPTYLFSVPLVYERLRTAAEARIQALPAPVRALVRAALRAAGRVRVDGAGRAGDRVLSRLADASVGRALRARLGGRVRALFSGGAPASPALFRFFEALGLPFVELYGMSETAGLISSNRFAGPRRPGSAGLPTPDHELRLDADGELLLRGPLLLSGYLDPEDAAAFTEDGWFRTGDLVHREADGTLRVEGRKKDLLVLSTGKKVSPGPIEQAIACAPPFQGAVLLGEGRAFVAAAVFVGREELDRLAAAGLEAGEALLERARAALGAFSDYEKPKRLLVIPGAPHEHPALVTPTLKLRRASVIASLGPEVARLYS